jgi:hypothetical protein
VVGGGRGAADGGGADGGGPVARSWMVTLEVSSSDAVDSIFFGGWKDKRISVFENDLQLGRIFIKRARRAVIKKRANRKSTIEKMSPAA